MFILNIFYISNIFLLYELLVKLWGIIMFKEEIKNYIRILDMNKRININYKLKDINLLVIISRNKWEYKDKNGMSIVMYLFS